MFAHALPQGSLRPAEALPPTLTPNAIFAMAPPAPRAMSFLGACLVYAACGAGLMFAPAIHTKVGTTTTRHFIFEDPTTTAAVVPPAVRQVPPAPQPGLIVKSAPQRPEGWTPPLETNVVPPTPTTLPTVDNSWKNARAATPEDAMRPTTPQTTGGFGTGTGTPTTVDIDFHQMRVLHRVDPAYPPLAKAARIQGEVVLLMTVDPQGFPSEVRALAGPHFTLEQEAMRVARLWRFEPASVNGQAVSAQFRLTIQFRLR